MKNKILSGFAALSIAAIAVFNLGLVSKNSDLSDVSLANIEALAEETVTFSGYCRMHISCFNSYGIATGNSSASSYQGPGCNGSSHSHSCSSCNS